ncbi:MAG: nitroreductase family protein, partial [Oscillibacter sp.]|nr:nitroreductase family protein [Oscillibacter sp.]
MNEVLKAIRDRRSIRKFRQEKLSAADLDVILDSGTWAATAKGMQPSLIVSVSSAEDVEALRKANAEIWERPDVDPFYGAPNIVVVLGDGEKVNWLQDGSLVMANLMLAAHAVGAGSCWINRAMEYFDQDDGKRMLEKWGIPSQYR